MKVRFIANCKSQKLQTPIEKTKTILFFSNIGNVMTRIVGCAISAFSEENVDFLFADQKLSELNSESFMIRVANLD